jgi:hypothetical protein
MAGWGLGGTAAGTRARAWPNLLLYDKTGWSGTRFVDLSFHHRSARGPAYSDSGPGLAPEAIAHLFESAAMDVPAALSFDSRSRRVMPREDRGARRNLFRRPSCAV